MRRTSSGDCVEDDVVTLGAAREVLARVVDDPVGAERPDELDVGRAAGRGHGRAHRLADLHGEVAHAAGAAVDQRRAPLTEPAVVAQRLECRAARDRQAGRLGEAEGYRLRGRRRLLDDARLA